MLKEHGIVIEVKDQFAIIQTQARNSCGQCAAGCGTAMFGQKVVQVKALNHKGAKVGDQVVIGLEEPALLKSSLALYFLPILSLFVAAMVVASLQLPESLTMLAALVGLLAGLKWAKRLMGKMSEDRRYQPIVLQTE
ncbi:hypothetical protein PN36_01545 [Candidatus Thiomargarita nelsonii]|uniref:Positive regulator of sigma E, RseC/MucC n=1 Tax=Candidatus Thiomargarita nelsonii TaxID=1003181 RepID=A0A4E0QXG8_9GAMM|nr:hypothetical protein PN36_01545 [Candidatus Thiomargarita nelsonii]